MSQDQKNSGALFAAIALGGIALLAWSERRAALRKRTVSREDRFKTNLALAGLTAGAEDVWGAWVASELSIERITVLSRSTAKG